MGFGVSTAFGFGGTVGFGVGFGVGGFVGGFVGGTVGFGGCGLATATAFTLILVGGFAGVDTTAFTATLGGGGKYSRLSFTLTLGLNRGKIELVICFKI